MAFARFVSFSLSVLAFFFFFLRCLMHFIDSHAIRRAKRKKCIETVYCRPCQGTILAPSSQKQQSPVLSSDSCISLARLDPKFAWFRSRPLNRVSFYRVSLFGCVFRTEGDGVGGRRRRRERVTWPGKNYREGHSYKTSTQVTHRAALAALLASYFLQTALIYALCVV